MNLWIPPPPTTPLPVFKWPGSILLNGELHNERLLDCAVQYLILQMRFTAYYASHFFTLFTLSAIICSFIFFLFIYLFIELFTF